MPSEARQHEKPEKHAVAQRRYYERQKRRGMSRKSVWVPDRGAEDFWNAVDALYARWKKQGLVD